MSPDARREQLLELGARLLSTRTLDELSIEVLAEEAGVSRGLIYHYFDSLKEFHVAVVRRAMADIYERTAPTGDMSDPMETLRGGIRAYVDYVCQHRVGYVSLVRAALGGDEELRAVYDETRAAMTARIFDLVTPEVLATFGIVDGVVTRFLTNAWAAMLESAVLDWLADPRGITRDELVRRLAYGLPALLTAGTRE